MLVYIPEEEYDTPSHKKLSHAMIVLSSDELLLIVKFNVCIESQPALFIYVFVYVPVKL